MSFVRSSPPTISKPECVGRGGAKTDSVSPCSKDSSIVLSIVLRKRGIPSLNGPSSGRLYRIGNRSQPRKQFTDPKTERFNLGICNPCWPESPYRLYTVETTRYDFSGTQGQMRCTGRVKR